ncbi:MAG: bifunctional DNA-formamidopyrimidine glycosylase/DNA-(apurinic or apyrimidinic site) lyase [Gammaproteobacteria bacterium]|nr:bifunctional DNA-formamidopyrimidine glycosylase/DNA-(apurinic or apyrimidinic site) lyase [Gammaproteobacteria bacterium]MCK5092323.1 bifunctional DNA-formamidopyrimidine glycosylase/DNA-(apurinic or apyrimidinic site) lyase [Gammaproteobacteria bacterium]
MPELPEVETTRRGIEPHILGRRIRKVIARTPSLRWPIPKRLLNQHMCGQKILAVERRGKYLLLRTKPGTLILHLGMSGSLRITSPEILPDKHDHLDILFEGGVVLRLHDPRRFGAALWTAKDPLKHKLLKDLGPEPFDEQFTGEYLFQRSRKRKQAIKQFIMDGHTVVGVGNIYASEALFLAGIRPGIAAGRTSLARYTILTKIINKLLNDAIKQGGTTLRDFLTSDGKPGYFSQHLNVYSRSGEPCHQCNSLIKQIRQGQRSTYYCPACQH